jgi:hypothetical protein
MADRSSGRKQRDIGVLFLVYGLGDIVGHGT